MPLFDLETQAMDFLINNHRGVKLCPSTHHIGLCVYCYRALFENKMADNYRGVAVELPVIESKHGEDVLGKSVKQFKDGDGVHGATVTERLGRVSQSISLPLRPLI